MNLPSGRARQLHAAPKQIAVIFFVVQVRYRVTRASEAHQLAKKVE